MRVEGTGRDGGRGEGSSGGRGGEVGCQRRRRSGRTGLSTEEDVGGRDETVNDKEEEEVVDRVIEGEILSEG